MRNIQQERKIKQNWLAKKIAFPQIKILLKTENPTAMCL